MRGYEILEAVGAAVILMGTTVTEITMIPVVAGIIVGFAGLIWGEEVRNHEQKNRIDRRNARARRMCKNIDIRVGK